MRALFRCFIGALVASGCSAPVPPAAPAGPAPDGALPRRASEFLVREATLLDGVVRVRADMPLAAGRKPAVIAMFRDTHQLVGAGYVAVTYEVNWARLRGPAPVAGPDSVGSWVLASPSAAVLGEAYLRDVSRNAGIVPVVLDWLEAQPEVDMARVAMVGGSTNGFVTLQAVALDRRLAAAVVIAACGDYRTFLRDSSMGIPGQPPLALAPEYAAWLDGQEIIAHPDRLVHAAVLMVNRSGDAVIPIACADQTARVLEAAYARAGAAERFRYVRLEREGHGLSTEEGRALFDWLQRWLRPGGT